MVPKLSSCEGWLRKACLRTSAAAGVLAGMVLFAPVPVEAACYEIIGCTNSDYFKQAQLKKFSCQILWEVRNTIYKENGYCFKTAKAIKVFGNAGCLYDDAAKVPLNKVERANVVTIKTCREAEGLPLTGPD